MCSREFPATTEYFNQKSSGKYGLNSRCKDCIKKVRKQSKEISSQYYQRNKEKIINRSKLYWNAHKEEKRQRDKLYKENHKEESKKYQKLYREEHREKANQYRKKYQREHKGITRRQWQKRRSLEKEIAATLTVSQWENIKSDFNNRCAYCGKESPLEQEHFIPLTKGGEYTINNIIPACKSCNSGKKTKDFFKWYPEQKFYDKRREKKILDYLNYNSKTKIQQLSICI